MSNEQPYEHEPDDPSKFYIYTGPEEVDGVMGKAKIKKWTHEGKHYERVLSFTPRQEIEEEREREKENQKHMETVDKTFLERGLSASDENPLNQGHQE